jgi:hypothetical protein
MRGRRERTKEGRKKERKKEGKRQEEEKEKKRKKRRVGDKFLDIIHSSIKVKSSSGRDKEMLIPCSTGDPRRIQYHLRKTLRPGMVHMELLGF